MKKNKIFVSAVLAVFMLTSLMVFSASATTIPTFTLASSASQLQYVIPQGTIFNGSIATTGAVRFFINDPNGTVFLNLGIIDKTTTFSFVAQQTGNYTLNFENDLTDSVQVSFSYVTNPELPGSGSSGGISFIYLPIFIIIAVVGSILIFFIVHRKTKKIYAIYDSEHPNS